MKKALSFLLCLVLAISALPWLTSRAGAASAPFDDISDSAYDQDILYVYRQGLLTGTGLRAFSPEADATRATLAVAIWRLAGKPVMGSGKSGAFGDVAEYAWYTEAVEWTAAAGIAGGYGNAFFGPADTLTREQLACLLWRYAKYRGFDVSIGEDANILSYDDVFDSSL